MSLVNDALKKARLEAARQDAARRGLPMPGATRPTATPIGAAWLFKAAAAVAVVIAAILIFFAGRSSSVPAAVATPSPVAEAIAQTSELPAGEEPRVELRQPEAPVRQVVEPPPPAATPAPEPIPEPATPTRTARIRTVLSPETPASADARARTPPPAQPSPPAARSARPTAGADAPKDVVRKIELSGSRRVELGGIAWSEERPFALINGRVVGPGDEVETLTVLDIGQRHVELRGAEGHFLLRLK